METSQICPPQVREAIIGARAAFERAGADGALLLDQATEAAEIMGGLTESTELAHALLARPLIAQAPGAAQRCVDIVGQGATDIAVALERLGALGLPRNWSPAHGLDTRQTETLRKMLLAVVSDPRLVLARLAEELVTLRHARALTALERERRALEARAVYAPLANRLGVWQLKWELEDLAFRYLEPDEYRRVAAALNERRADRERFIAALCAELQAELQSAGISAQVYGRPKHIYSIYRKMQRKQLAFEQLFDVRAVRIVVASMSECYAALGVVHGRWPYIPGEFDDYIATPKANGYRSIHTAVIGPQTRSVEVQIRTRDMHEHAELGVAAHWTYKEDSAQDAQYQRKIEWVRKLLEPQEGAAGDADRDLIEGMRAELFERPRLRADAQGRGDRPATRRHAAGFRLQRTHLARASLPWRQGQRPHRAAHAPARQRRDRRDHHHKARGPEPRLARARAGLSGLGAQPRQGARLVPPPGRRRQPQCRRTSRRARARAHRGGTCAAGSPRQRAARPRRRPPASAFRRR